MGIPRFFKFLSKTYPNLLRRKLQLEKNARKEDLYIDVNTPLHEICQRVFKYGLEREPTTDDAIIQDYFRRLIAGGKIDEVMRIIKRLLGFYLIYSYKTYRPTRRFMYGIDGAAPAAKMTQQRSRRFKSDSSPLDFFDPTMLSPGTRFMDELHDFLSKDFVQLYRTEFSAGVQVIYSSHREPGEGEHKLFDQMNSAHVGHDEKLLGQVRGGIPYSIVLGADSDLIVLSLSKRHNIMFARKPIPEGQAKRAAKKEMDALEQCIQMFLLPQCSAGPPDPDNVQYRAHIESVWTEYFTNAFVWLDVTRLRQTIIDDYLAPNHIMDFTLMTFFVGNDFLPPIPEIEIVTMNTPAIFSDDDIQIRFNDIHESVQRFKKIPKEKKIAFSVDKFIKEFDEKALTWNFRDNTANIDFTNAKGLWNERDGQHEMYPYQRDSLNGSLYRVLYRKGNGETKWRPVEDDVGGLSRCLVLYRNLVARIQGRIRSQGNTFLIERNHRINYVNLLSYFRDLQAHATLFMDAHKMQREISMRTKGKSDPLVEMSIGIDEKKKAIIPAAFVENHHRLAFGIYDSIYADPELPKQTREDMCRKWLEGAQWTLRYYSEGFRSINTRWFYPYDRSPSISDLVDFIQDRMVVTVKGYPDIHVSPFDFEAEIQRIDVNGIVISRAGAPPTINTKFVGSIVTYVDSLAQTIALFKHPSSQEKYIDLSQVNFVKTVRKFSQSLTGVSLTNDDVIGVDPTKINMISDRSEVIKIPIEREFTLVDEIYRVISNMTMPYATIVESMFSIMPERVLKLILTPELVDAVLMELTDFFPATVETIVDGKFYDDGGVPKLPKISPTRIQRAIDNLPTKYDLEISRLNNKHARWLVVYFEQPSRLEEFKSRGRGARGATALKTFGSAAANVDKKTSRRQDKKKEPVVEFTSGGYGTSMGGILPQYLEYFSKLKSSRVGLKQVTANPLLTPEESTIIYQFAGLVFEFPTIKVSPIEMNPLNYYGLPATLAYRSNPLKGDQAPNLKMRQALNERRKMVNDLYFLNANLTNIERVVVVGIESSTTSRWLILAGLYPNVQFDLWESKKLTTDFSSTPNVLVYSSQIISAGPMKALSPQILKYRQQRILLIADLEWLPGAPTIDSKSIPMFNFVQQRLVNILNPIASLLKFRLPYSDTIVDYPYIDGEIWLQPWGSARLAETRLITNINAAIEVQTTPENVKTWLQLDIPNAVAVLGPTFKVQRVRNYNRVEYENKLYYFNLIIRTRAIVKNSLSLDLTQIPSLLHSYEYGLEIGAWQHWIRTWRPATDVAQQKEAVAVLMRDTDRVLGYGLDGKLITVEETAKATDDKFKSQKPVMITFADINDRRKYENIKINNKHDGQRKLLLSEVQFLAEHNGRVVVYAGAAPSVKGAFLASLFPNRTFVLVDPNRFNIAPYGNVSVVNARRIQDVNFQQPGIFIINSLMTEDIAKFVVGMVGSNDLLFISDIRTTINDGVASSNNEPTTTDIVWNMAQMAIWMKIMTPNASLIKFRLPFDSNGQLNNPTVAADVEKAKKLGLDLGPVMTGARLRYFEGKLNLQAWAPASSAETRLVITRDGLNRIVDYPLLNDYEDAMFFYNSVQRQAKDIYNSDARDDSENTQDMALEYYIWNLYLKSSGGSGNARSLAVEATKAIGKERRAVTKKPVAKRR